jgi:ABC-type transport system involved in multi-copper enzyme maturation permease subunit
MSSFVQPSRDGADLRAALRAEWTKFRTVRGWMIGLVFAGLMVVLFTFLQARGKNESFCTTPTPGSCVAGHPYVPTGPSGEAVADTYQLVAMRLTTDGTVTARITSLAGRIWAGPANEAPSLRDTQPGLTGWAKAGLLITPSLRQGSAYAAVMATGGHGVHFQYDYTNDQAGLPGSISGTTPRWLRLTRTGDTITGYDSSDGTRWRRVGSARLPGPPTTVYVGLFATSPTTAEGSATQATASFDHITAGPAADGGTHAATGQWHGASIGTGPQDYYTTLGKGGFREVGDSVVVTGSGDIAPAVASAGGDTASDSLLFGLVVALIVLIVIGTMFITSEYRRGLIRTTFAATPDRGRVLGAKAVVIATVAFAVGAVASAVAIPLGEQVMSTNGNYIFPATPLTVVRVIVGSGLLAALTAVAVLGLGTILRRSAGAILVGVVVFVLPTFAGPGLIGPTSAGGAATWLYRVTPAAGFSMLGLLPRSSLVSYPYTMANGYYPLPPWAGLAVLAAYAGAALLAARVVLRRRDA